MRQPAGWCGWCGFGIHEARRTFCGSASLSLSSPRETRHARKEGFGLAAGTTSPSLCTLNVFLFSGCVNAPQSIQKSC